MSIDPCFKSHSIDNNTFEEGKNTKTKLNSNDLYPSWFAYSDQQTTNTPEPVAVRLGPNEISCMKADSDDMINSTDQNLYTKGISSSYNPMIGSRMTQASQIKEQHIAFGEKDNTTTDEYENHSHYDNLLHELTSYRLTSESPNLHDLNNTNLLNIRYKQIKVQSETMAQEFSQMALDSNLSLDDQYFTYTASKPGTNRTNDPVCKIEAREPDVHVIYQNNVRTLYEKKTNIGEYSTDSLYPHRSPDYQKSYGLGYNISNDNNSEFPLDSANTDQDLDKIEPVEEEPVPLILKAYDETMDDDQDFDLDYQKKTEGGFLNPFYEICEMQPEENFPQVQTKIVLHQDEKEEIGGNSQISNYSTNFSTESQNLSSEALAGESLNQDTLTQSKSRDSFFVYEEKGWDQVEAGEALNAMPLSPNSMKYDDSLRVPTVDTQDLPSSASDTQGPTVEQTASVQEDDNALHVELEDHLSDNEAYGIDREGTISAFDVNERSDRLDRRASYRYDEIDRHQALETKADLEEYEQHNKVNNDFSGLGTDRMQSHRQTRMMLPDQKGDVPHSMLYASTRTRRLSSTRDDGSSRASTLSKFQKGYTDANSSRHSEHSDVQTDGFLYSCPDSDNPKDFQPGSFQTHQDDRESSLLSGDRESPSIAFTVRKDARLSTDVSTAPPSFRRVSEGHPSVPKNSIDFLSSDTLVSTSQREPSHDYSTSFNFVPDVFASDPALNNTNHHVFNLGQEENEAALRSDNTSNDNRVEDRVTPFTDACRSMNENFNADSLDKSLISSLSLNHVMNFDEFSTGSDNYAHFDKMKKCARPICYAFSSILVVSSNTSRVVCYQLADLLSEDPNIQSLRQFPGPISFRNQRERAPELDQFLVGQSPILPPFPDADARPFSPSCLLWTLVIALMNTKGTLLRDKEVLKNFHKLLVYAQDRVKPTASLSAVLDSVQHFEKSRLNEALLKIQELVVYGKREDAVREAIRLRMWDHALILGNSLGPSHYREVVSKFVRASIRPGFPLRTAYLHWISRENENFERPLARPDSSYRDLVSSFGDLNEAVEGDDDDSDWRSHRPSVKDVSPTKTFPDWALHLKRHWRTHVAIILADWLFSQSQASGDSSQNSMKRGDIGTSPAYQSSLCHLGDVLWNDCHLVSAAHLCYLLAGRYPLGEDELEPAPRCLFDIPIVLVGGDHRCHPRTIWFNAEALYRSELVEYLFYLQGLSKVNEVSEERKEASKRFCWILQSFKLVHAFYLSSLGFLETAMSYLDSIWWFWCRDVDGGGVVWPEVPLIDWHGFSARFEDLYTRLLMIGVRSEFELDERLIQWRCQVAQREYAKAYESSRVLQRIEERISSLGEVKSLESHRPQPKVIDRDVSKGIEHTRTNAYEQASITKSQRDSLLSLSSSRLGIGSNRSMLPDLSSAKKKKDYINQLKRTVGRTSDSKRSWEKNNTGILTPGKKGGPEPVVKEESRETTNGECHVDFGDEGQKSVAFREPSEEGRVEFTVAGSETSRPDVPGGLEIGREIEASARLSFEKPAFQPMPAASTASLADQDATAAPDSLAPRSGDSPLEPGDEAPPSFPFWKKPITKPPPNLSLSDSTSNKNGIVRNFFGVFSRLMQRKKEPEESVVEKPQAMSEEELAGLLGKGRGLMQHRTRKSNQGRAILTVDGMIVDPRKQKMSADFSKMMAPWTVQPFDSNRPSVPDETGKNVMTFVPSSDKKELTEEYSGPS